MLADIVVWLVLGLIAGGLAKFIMPGKDPGGLGATIGIGIVGSFVGGYVGRAMGLTTQTGGLSTASIGTAVGGALILLLAFRMMKR